jgi:hypothetical protein
LTNCPGNGLVAGADGITIDLNGHTLDGAGNAMTCDRPERPRTGVDASGHDGVTVSNGTVQQFATGVSAGSASNGRVHHLTLRENPLGGVVLASAPGAPATVGNRVDHNASSPEPSATPG